MPKGHTVIIVCHQGLANYKNIKGPKSQYCHCLYLCLCLSIIHYPDNIHQYFIPSPYPWAKVYGILRALTTGPKPYIQPQCPLSQWSIAPHMGRSQGKKVIIISIAHACRVHSRVSQKYKKCSNHSDILAHYGAHNLRLNRKNLELIDVNCQVDDFF